MVLAAGACGSEDGSGVIVSTLWEAAWAEVGIPGRSG